MKPEKIQSLALEDYRQGDSLKNIAVRYRISIGTVSLWAKKAGLKRRSRGCRPKTRPSEQDLQIVAAVDAVEGGKPTLDEIGRKFGYTRAGIHRIYHRWKTWKPSAPFKVGERVRFAGRDYQILKAGVFGGRVLDLKHQTETTIKWWRDPRTFAVKL